MFPFKVIWLKKLNFWSDYFLNDIILKRILTKKNLQSVIVLREQRFSVIHSVPLLEVAFVNYIKILLVDSLEHIKMGRFHPIW